MYNDSLCYYYYCRKDNNSGKLCPHPRPHTYLGHAAQFPFLPGIPLPFSKPAHLAPVQSYPYPAPFSPLGPKPGCWGGKEERRENVAILGQRSRSRGEGVGVAGERTRSSRLLIGKGPCLILRDRGQAWALSQVQRAGPRPSSWPRRQHR